ncbi:MAG: hypothetical protein L0228_03740 [Planctomycetes bacterium]|nr:hypothetical protein [Planctomycetota bacterium]
MTVQAVVAPAFLLIGLSHLLQPQLWVRFFEVVKQTGVAAAIIPMYTLPLGLVLIVGHNVWAIGWPLFLTLAGWLMMIKCALYLLVPSAADQVLEKQPAKSARSFRLAGAIMTFLGGVLTWQAWT